MQNESLNDAIVRQGDVLLVRAPVDIIDATVERNENRTVLAHGEVTGHAHAFYGNNGNTANVFNTKKGRHLCVVETDFLRHEEHTKIQVTPGTYDLPAQMEHTDDDDPLPVRD